MSANRDKPLGIKAYGSIPHLLGSRLGPGDHHISEGQSKMCTEKKKHPQDRVHIQAKLDGSCVCVAKIGNELVPLTRYGYHVNSSNFAFLREFDNFVKVHRTNFDHLLLEGERVCGEWLVMPHGTLYLRRDPFYAFDIFGVDGKRVHVDNFMTRCVKSGIPYVPTMLDYGPKIPELAIEVISDLLYAEMIESIDPPEGVVYRYENSQNKKGMFIAKWVRPDKIDGKYFTGKSNKK